MEWHSQKFDIKKEILELMKEKTESRKDKLKRGELSSEIRKLNDEIWNINVSIALSYKNEYEDRYFAKKSQPKECK
ncbi:TPA: hypothetical protein DEP21_03040 [Patescibacteria group bacterium]|nr:hypothetical protein [Candidatus Gracilibacteria bacterium]